MNRLFVIAFCAFTIAGCASAPPKSAQTASGHPEVIVNTKDTKAVRSNLIARNASTGWVLEQESDNTILFTRTDSSGSLQSATTQVLLGNAHSTPPKYEVRYTIFAVPEGTRVVAIVAVSTQMPGGQVNRMGLSDAAGTFNQFQAQLEKVKIEVEAGAAAAS
jgi:hypothetical protein